MSTPKYQLIEEEYVTSHQPINLRVIVQTLIEKAWIIILCVIAGGFLTFLYLKHATRMYAAKAVLQVETEKPNVAPVEGVLVENFNSIDFVKTIEQSLQSRSVFERVVEANNLAEDPRFIEADRPEPLSKRSVISYANNITGVRQRPGTRLIDVVVEHPNAEMTAIVANSVVEQFIRQTLDQSSSTSELATGLLLEKADDLRSKVEKSNQALQAFRERTKFIPTEVQQSTILSQLEQTLMAAKARRLEMETEYVQFLRSTNDLEAVMAIPLVALHPTVNLLRNQITDRQNEFDLVKQRYEQKHPRYIQAQAHVTNLLIALKHAILQAGESKRIALDNAKEAQGAIEQQIKNEQLANLESNKLAIEYAALVREAQSDNDVYQSFLKRMKETAAAKDLDLSKIKIVQRADIPERPIRPQREQALLIGLTLGGILGIGLALLIGAMDSSLRSMDEAEQYLRMPALSTVPQIGPGHLDSTQLVMAKNNVLSGAESFRSLRTSLSLLGRKAEQRIFLFTSALPEEGKTFCSLNYAFSLAQQGLRVLLIDCDLRRPAVEQCLCGSCGQLSGVADYLTGAHTLQEIIHDTGIPNFAFAPAGVHVPNPSELLAQEKFNELIQEALKQFDRVVLDSAPIFGVSDTLLMANRIDVACLVVRACKTPRKKVFRAVQILQKAGAPLAGMVLNRIPPNDRRNGDDPYYDYGYSHDNRSQTIVPLLKAS